jgi:DNA-directed RNA polymerase alpha subunit
MITREEFLNAIETINSYKKQLTEPFEKMKADLDNKDFSYLILNENTSVFECNLSTIIPRILRDNDIKKLGDLKNFKKKDLLSFWSFGKKHLSELERCLFQAGIILV